MTDMFDRATEREERFREEAIERQRFNNPTRGKTYMDSARECHVCDEPIPEERRREVPGVQTCFDCQTDIENELKRAARPR